MSSVAPETAHTLVVELAKPTSSPDVAVADRITGVDVNVREPNGAKSILWLACTTAAACWNSKAPTSHAFWPSTLGRGSPRSSVATVQSMAGTSS
ncbi:MAG TPA: hypothetical protein VGG17_06505 [Acidimicrobiales bacterium]